MRLWWRALGVVAAVSMLGAGCSSGGDEAETPNIGGTAAPGGEVAWPAPPSDEVARLTEAAGLELEPREQLAFHVHAHLDVFIEGKHRSVPAGLGIVIDDPGVRTFDEGGVVSYGGIQGCDTPCISPLHTHDPSGVLHTESATSKGNTLGQLFTEWDVRLDARCVGDYCTNDLPIRVFVDGDEVRLADAAAIPLSDGKEIAITIGALPPRVPSKGDFSEG